MDNNSVVKVVAAVGLLAGAGVAAFMFCKQRCSQRSNFNLAQSSMDDAGGSAATGTILCTINGRPVIHESDFNQSMAQMLQQSFKGASPDVLPMAIKRKFFDQLVQQELIVCEAEKAHIENDPEFTKAFNDMVKMLKRHLQVQFTEKKIFDGINVDDEEIAKHYAEHKDRYVKDPGGILAAGVKFGSEGDANAFFKKASTDVKKFEEQAKLASKDGFKDFGRISKAARGYAAMSVPGPVRDAVSATTDFPHVDVVKAGKEFWVVLSQDSKAPDYFELKDISTQIAGMIKNTKFKEVLDHRLQDIRDHMTVVINEDFFKEPEKTDADDSTGKAMAKLAQAAVKKNMLAEKIDKAEQVATV